MHSARQSTWIRQESDPHARTQRTSYL